MSRFLWRAANRFTFDAREAAALFQRNVFIIAMPASLFDYLTAFTWEQVENSLVYILICLADGHQGIDVLKHDLAPALVAKVDHFTGLPNPASLVDRLAFRLFIDVVMDRIAWMGPWVVPTTLCYLSAGDMTQMLARRLERDIFSAPDKFDVAQSMMWNIYCDWRTYHNMLVLNAGWSRRDALHLMARTISKGAQSAVNTEFRTVLRLCGETDEYNFNDRPLPGASVSFSSLSSFPFKEAGHGLAKKDEQVNGEKAEAGRRRKRMPSLLEQLPSDVIVNKIVPMVFEAHANDERERRRPDGSVAGARGTTPDQGRTSPVSGPFTLKSWVLENYKLELFYRKCEEGMSGQEGEMGVGSELEDGEADVVDVEVVGEVDRETEGGEEGSEGSGAMEMSLSVASVVVDVGDEDLVEGEEEDMVEIAEPIADIGESGDEMAVEEGMSAYVDLTEVSENLEAISVEYLDVRAAVVQVVADVGQGERGRWVTTARVVEGGGDASSTRQASGRYCT